MRQYIAAVFLAGATLFSFGSVQAEFTSWESSSYDFSKVNSIYVAEMDTSEVSLSQVKEQKVKAILDNKLAKLSLPKSLALYSGFGLDSEISSPRVEKASVENRENSEDFISEEAEDFGADVYIIPRLTRWNVDSYVIPAHTEWRSRQVKDAWKDKDGNWHESYHTERYPEFVPAQTVPYSEVTVSFEWYDGRTEELIASSEDARERNMEDNPQGIYERIVERFTKNLKKTVKR